MRIGNKTWSRYKKLVQKFLSEEAGLKPITWLVHLSQPLPFGEDVGSCYLSRTLQVLVGYNVMRTWPINQVTPSGELDNETCYIIISNDKLAELGYLDEHGYFKFDITRDRFIIDGISYKSSGDTQYAQAREDELVSMVILKRITNENLEQYKIVEEPSETTEEETTEEETP